MTDLSRIFYPERNEYDGVIYKFVPDKTIDRNRLTIVFFQPREQDYWAAVTDIHNNQRDETIAESLEQLREVADLLDIHVAEIPRQQHDDLSEPIRPEFHS